VRAYTDSVAQALAGAVLVPLVRQRSLQCAVPYALEGLLRREIASAGATLVQVSHDRMVHFSLTLPEPEAAGFIARVDDAAQGRAVWQQA
jgi:putative IMPACT (imprinted ancient) family translation regulator